MVNEKKAKPESLDFFLAAIAPVFIIGMIGSLVYFIIMVLYEGPFIIRLMWILGLYTVAAVLIARIAIEQSRPLAFAYMFALGGATLIVAPQFMTVTGPLAFLSFPILLGLLVLVAVLADRITFDCTSMNEHVQSTGVGLLQSLGLVQSERKQSEPRSAGKRPNEGEQPEGEQPESSRKKTSSKRKHNPGVWVLYFALLALPLFGLGQMVIQNPSDRRWAFTYLFFYLLSSMFLLVLISLLSLRKYLRERGVPMEFSFAVRWLAIGMTSVFLVLFVLSLLPIPSHSLLSMDLPFRITSRDDLKANKWGWGPEGVEGDGPKQGKPDGAQQPDPGQENQEGAAEGQGKAAGGKKEGRKDGKGESDGGSQKGEGKPSDSKPSDSKQSDNKPSDNKQSDNKQSDNKPSDNKPSDNKPSDNKPSDNKPSDNKPSDNKPSEKSPSGDGKKGEDKQGDSSGEQPKDPAKNKNDPNRPAEQPANQPAEQKAKDGQKPPPKDNEPANRDKPKEAPEPQKPQPQAPEMSIQWNLSATVQWIVMLILLIVAIVFGIKYRNELFQAIQSFRDWLSALFGRRKKSLIPADQVVEGAETLADLYPPFSSFADPFVSGSGWSREQIVRHMYRAVMSWGYEHRVVRREDETPEEFVRRLARRFPEQQEQFGMLGIFYNRIAYARGTIGSSEIKPMAELWRWLSATPAL